MNREQIIASLRTHKSELKSVGVLGVSVFGSVGRGDAGKDSDVDVAVRLGEGFSRGGFDWAIWRLSLCQAGLG
jgi:predicted nucleotidyltransferase